MKQSSEKTIRPTISDILLDIEDIRCSYKTHFNKGERNDVGYSKINSISIRIKSPCCMVSRVNLFSDDYYISNDIIRETIDRLSSYLEYEGFKKVCQINDIYSTELQYEVINH